MTPRPTEVVVFTTSRSPLLHSCLGIARSLGRLGVPVHLAGGTRRNPARRSRYVRSLVELPVDDVAATVAALVQRGAGADEPPILLPVDDAATLLVEDHADVLSGVFRFPRQPAGLARTLSDKAALADLARAVDVPTPASQRPADLSELRSFARRVGFPVVAKATNPITLAAARPAGRSVTVAGELAELETVYESLRGDVLLQEYLPGGPESVWMFNGYFDADSRARFAATAVKLRQCLPDTGPTCLGECRSNPGLRQATVDFLSAVGYRGIVDLGWRYDARDGSFKLLDVNPRIGGSFRLFVADSGMDVARALYLDLTGRDLPEASVRDGRRWLVEPFDVQASLIYHRQGRLGWREWVRSLRGIDECAWFARDDPLPFAGMIFRAASMLHRRRTGAAAEEGPWQETNPTPSGSSTSPAPPEPEAPSSTGSSASSTASSPPASWDTCSGVGSSRDVPAAAGPR